MLSFPSRGFLQKQFVILRDASLHLKGVVAIPSLVVKPGLLFTWYYQVVQYRLNLPAWDRPGVEASWKGNRSLRTRLVLGLPTSGDDL